MSPLKRQIWAVSAILINMFGQGMVLSFSSAILPALNRPDSLIKTDLHTGSWFASVIGLAAIPGVLLSSIIMDIYGRRLTHGVFIFPGVLGWALIYFAKDMKTLMIGRLLGGFCASATVTLGAVIIGEYSSPKYRGVFLYLKNALVCIGASFVHLISYFVFWRTIALIAIIPLIIALGINFTWPESPSWLVANGQIEKCEKAFYYLRGTNEDSSRELKEMIKAQSFTKPTEKLTFQQKTVNSLTKFTRKDFLKPLTIMCLATVVLEVSGRHIFPAYAMQIVSMLTGKKSEVFYYTLGIDVIIAASATFSTFLVKIMNRRTLLFYTGFGAVAVLMILCGRLFLATKGFISNSSSLLEISLLTLYFVLANLGCAPIPLALIGEMFPLAHKGAGTAITGMCVATFLMAGIKATPHLLESIHIYGTFTVYGAIMFVSLLILYYMMPETKDKTLQEIENYFNYGKYDAEELDEDDEAKVKMIGA